MDSSLLTSHAIVRFDRLLPDEPEHIVVDVVWKGVNLDRPCAGGYGLPHNSRGLALCVRLVNAINSQKAFSNPKIVRDVNGQTYVQADHEVCGKFLNEDLIRIGF